MICLIQNICIGNNVHRVNDLTTSMINVHAIDEIRAGVFSMIMYNICICLVVH